MKTDRKLAFFKGVGQFGLKFQAKGDISHQPFFMSQKVHISIFHMVREFGLKFCYNSS